MPGRAHPSTRSGIPLFKGKAQRGFFALNTLRIENEE